MSNYFRCFTLALLLSITFNANGEIYEADLYIKDHKFDPEIVEVPVGRKIRLTVHNMDSTIEEFESTELKREKIIPGKSKARVILAPLEVGEYKFFGEFHEETAQGKIVVKQVEEDE